MIRRALLFVTCSLLVVPTLRAGNFDLDKNHSSIGFKVRHMGVANVRGHFEDFTMDLTVDESDPTNSSVAFAIDAASINTNNSRRDDDLRASSFLDVANHPEIRFESRSIRTEGETYVVTGDLTIRGVTKEVDLLVSVGGPINDPWGNRRVGIEGGVTIDRREFGVVYDRLLETGGLVVANEVNIEFAIEAIQPGS